MSYSNFTLDDLKYKLNLQLVQIQSLFPEPPQEALSDDLQRYLARYKALALAIDTEKARSEYIIAPMLGELKLAHFEQLSLFSGIDFSVDQALGLSGRCDYILSKSPDQYALTAPVVMLVEAKHDNIKNGIAQCGAEMFAAQKYNQAKNNSLDCIYGCISTGTNWKFLQLKDKQLIIDLEEYYIDSPQKIMGILSSMVR